MVNWILTIEITLDKLSINTNRIGYYFDGILDGILDISVDSLNCREKLFSFIDELNEYGYLSWFYNINKFLFNSKYKDSLILSSFVSRMKHCFLPMHREQSDYESCKRACAMLILINLYDTQSENHCLLSN